jgi:hypothetical protein
MIDQASHRFVPNIYIYILPLCVDLEGVSSCLAAQNVESLRWEYCWDPIWEGFHLRIRTRHNFQEKGNIIFVKHICFTIVGVPCCSSRLRITIFEICSFIFS